MKKLIKKVYTFCRYNTNKILYLQILFCSAFFRLCILLLPMKFLKKYMGKENEESSREETIDRCQQARKISYAVNRICNQTPWESKCFVRALTVQFFLKKKHIPSTLYLGVGKNNEKLIAHAWIRSGSIYLSGGYGEGYTIVTKFRT